MRTKNPLIVLGPDGRPLAGASVYTRLRASGADASVHAAETGAAAGDNPAITDAYGRVTQWLDRGAYASTITADGMDPWVEPWDSAPASDASIDDAWVPDGLIVTRMLPASAVSYTKLAADVLSALVPIGARISGPWTALPAGGRFDWADGGLIDKTTYAAFFAAAGHVYNGGVDPGANKVRKPDSRGRVVAGADNFGQGAANRIPNSNRALGQSGGEERHALTNAEMPSVISVPGPSAGGVAIGFGGLYVDAAAGAGGDSKLQGNLAIVGGGGAHNVMQPYEIDNVIVRVA